MYFTHKNIRTLWNFERPSAVRAAATALPCRIPIQLHMATPNDRNREKWDVHHENLTLLHHFKTRYTHWTQFQDTKKQRNFGTPVCGPRRGQPALVDPLWIAPFGHYKRPKLYKTGHTSREPGALAKTYINYTHWDTPNKTTNFRILHALRVHLREQPDDPNQDIVENLRNSTHFARWTTETERIYYDYTA